MIHTIRVGLGFIVMILLNIQCFAQLSDALSLKLSSGPYSDETVIRFLEVATDSFDSDWDAYKLRNGGNTPNFFTVTNSVSFTINALHKPYTDKSVPLHIEVAFSGDYTINAEEIGLFDSLCTITLVDKVLNISQDLKLFPSYSFAFVKGAPSDRFLINFTMATQSDSSQVSLTSISTQSIENSLLIYNIDDKVVIDFKDISTDVSIGIYDLSGKEILKPETIHISSSNSIWEFYSGQNGVCIVRVISGDILYSDRLYLGDN